MRLDTTRTMLTEASWSVTNIDKDRLQTMGYVDGITAKSPIADEELTVLISTRDAFFEYTPYFPYEFEDNNQTRLVDKIELMTTAIINKDYKEDIYADRNGNKVGSVIKLFLEDEFPNVGLRTGKTGIFYKKMK